MTNEEIKEIQREIRETQARLTSLQKVADQLKPEPWARWRAELATTYYFVYANGWRGVGVDHYDAISTARYDLGNYFRTQELAERHAKRLRSMVPTCAMPGYEQEHFAVIVEGDSLEIEDREWTSEKCDFDIYFSGRVFATKEAAEAWIAEFGDVWTSRVEGEGE